MNLDDRLLLLGAAPAHPGLEQLDGAALAGRAVRERRESLAMTSVAAVAALGIGVISGAVMVSEERGITAPFGPPVALTPLIALGRG